MTEPLSPSTGISGYNKLPGVKDSGIKSASDWLSGLKHVTLYWGFQYEQVTNKICPLSQEKLLPFFFNIGAKNNIPFNLAASFAVFTVCFKIY